MSHILSPSLELLEECMIRILWKSSAYLKAKKSTRARTSWVSLLSDSKTITTRGDVYKILDCFANLDACIQLKKQMNQEPVTLLSWPETSWIFLRWALPIFHFFIWVVPMFAIPWLVYSLLLRSHSPQYPLISCWWTDPTAPLRIKGSILARLSPLFPTFHLAKQLPGAYFIITATAVIHELRTGSLIYQYFWSKSIDDWYINQ